MRVEDLMCYESVVIKREDLISDDVWFKQTYPAIIIDIHKERQG